MCQIAPAIQARAYADSTFFSDMFVPDPGLSKVWILPQVTGRSLSRLTVPPPPCTLSPLSHTTTTTSTRYLTLAGFYILVEAAAD